MLLVRKREKFTGKYRKYVYYVKVGVVFMYNLCVY